MSGSREISGPLFGTDGVRDRGGEGLLAPDSVRRLVSATARVLGDRSRFAEDFEEDRGGWVYVARDTRISGEEIQSIVSEEFRRCGYGVANIGVLPTPGAAHAAAANRECCLAVVISASHNPAEYNGIKFLAPTGAKISPEFEAAVEQVYRDGVAEPPAAAVTQGAGKERDVSGEVLDQYVRFLVSRCRRPERLRGGKVCLDTANGAAYEVGPRVFSLLGMDVDTIGAAPDGTNINESCGALFPDRLAERVVARGAAIGFSFDGDADRMIPVSAAGRVLDGDYVLALAGRSYHRDGRLPRKTVVGTVMSNLGLEKSLSEEGLNLLRTPVGDRHVYRALVDEGHPFGGEQSGHLIFLEESRTGDGVLAAVHLCDLLESESLDLEGESKIMSRYPQVLRNLRVPRKRPLEELDGVQKAARDAEACLGADGRVLVRYSGTEPLLRVMIEGRERSLVEDLCDTIIRAAETELSA